LRILDRAIELVVMCDDTPFRVCCCLDEFLWRPEAEPRCPQLDWITVHSEATAHHFCARVGRIPIRADIGEIDQAARFKVAK
jgi:hypothetical protein